MLLGLLGNTKKTSFLAHSSSVHVWREGVKLFCSPERALHDILYNNGPKKRKRASMSKHILSRPLFIGTLSTLVGTFGGALSVAYYVVNRLTRPATPSGIDTYFFTPFEFGVTFEAV